MAPALYLLGAMEYPAHLLREGRYGAESKVSMAEFFYFSKYLIHFRFNGLRPCSTIGILVKSCP